MFLDRGTNIFGPPAVERHSRPATGENGQDSIQTPDVIQHQEWDGDQSGSRGFFELLE